MNNDVRETAYAIEQKLNLLLLDVQHATDEALASKDLPTAAAHFQELRNAVGAIGDALKPVTEYVKTLSEETIPTMFLNARTKSARYDGIGMVKINTRWHAQMIDPEQAMNWLEAHGNGGLIKRTVHPNTLTAVAKDAAKSKDPLPADLFRVSTSNYVSITK